jgi:Lrp/AsnC family leucine-responsive transcriptional regulator
MRRLGEVGVLSRFVALIDPHTVGLQITAFARVALDRQEASQLDLFERTVASWPEVMECYLMTGDADYQLRVLTRSLADYEAFLRDRLTRIPGVAKIQSSFAFRPVVYRTELPL